MSAVDFWIFVSSLADRNLLLFASVILIIYLFYKKEHKKAILFLVASLGGIVLNKILKEIFQVPRPSDALIPIQGYSFPSGHAMSAVIFYSLLVFIFYKKIKNKIARNIFILANALVILLVGLSRIMLKVHTIYDVMGGYIIGLLWLFVAYKSLLKINPKKQNRK